MRRLATTLTLALVGTSAGSALGSGPAASYEHAFQRLSGYPAKFFVSGPATGDYPDVEGDAILDRVEYAAGDVFYFFYKPVDIFDITYSGDAGTWSVRAGARTTVGLSGRSVYEDYDDDADGVEAFEGLMLQAMNNNNLNNYVDLHHNAPRFSFTIAFDRVVKDNDAGPERVPHRPEDGQHVHRHQPAGRDRVPVLRVSNDLPGEPAYTGGGDLNPDFKIMTVITNERQLTQHLGTFD